MTARLSCRAVYASQWHERKSACSREVRVSWVRIGALDFRMSNVGSSRFQILNNARFHPILTPVSHSEYRLFNYCWLFLISSTVSAKMFFFVESTRSPEFLHVKTVLTPLSPSCFGFMRVFWLRPFRGSMWHHATPIVPARKCSPASSARLASLLWVAVG